MSNSSTNSSQQPKTCPLCKGQKGLATNDSWYPCARCGGTGLKGSATIPSEARQLQNTLQDQENERIKLGTRQTRPSEAKNSPKEEFRASVSRKYSNNNTSEAPPAREGKHDPLLCSNHTHPLLADPTLPQKPVEPKPEHPCLGCGGMEWELNVRGLWYCGRCLENATPTPQESVEQEDEPEDDFGLVSSVEVHCPGCTGHVPAQPQPKGEIEQIFQHLQANSRNTASWVRAKRAVQALLTSESAKAEAKGYALGFEAGGKVVIGEDEAFEHFNLHPDDPALKEFKTFVESRNNLRAEQRQILADLNHKQENGND